MSGEWKPGDVAMVTFDNASLNMRQRGESDITTSIGLRREDDWGLPSYGSSIESDDARALVVIDPEDREQVECLVARFFGMKTASEVDADAMQAALRALANPQPPKPDEPTGLGAVVEVETNRPELAGMKMRLVRTHATKQPWWGDNQSRDWDEIPGPIEVLSEGVA